MKKYLKETWYMYVITFILCFMMFLYEPLVMFLNNTSDFWFGIGTMFKMTIMLFFIVFIAIIAGFNIIYFLNRDKSKKIFKICIMIMFIVFICSYIQGNFLVGNLPVLDGTTIEWSNYKSDWIISGIVWLVGIVGIVFAIKKLTLDKMVKYSAYASLAVLLMLSLSFVTTLLSNQAGTEEKSFIPIVTYKNINKYSSDKNFVILLLDCVDSKTFMERLGEDKDMLKDFTYYEDTMSGHPFTIESIPLILTGKYFKNDAPMTKWATQAYKESELFDLIEKNNYELDVYEQDIMYYDESASRISNVVDGTNGDNVISKIKFWKQEIKYIMFRYLPSFLKKYSKVDEMHFTALYISNRNSNFDEMVFDPDDYEMMKLIESNKIEKTNDKVFKFIHLDGAHAPWFYDKNYNTIENATFEDEVDASITLTKAYLQELKDNNVYDNTAIIIMADHGFPTEKNGEQRQNPLFLVKGVNETHKSMQTSDKAIHFVDLTDLYKDLIAGKKTNEVFKNISNKRTRQFMQYSNSNDKPMVEYETKGKAWEKDKMYKTGKEYTKKG